MFHDSTWLTRTRAMRWMRPMAPVGLLLACILLAGFPAVASATTTEIRGEWELSLTTPTQHVRGKALIAQEANAQGEFASSTALFEGLIDGTFSGTVEGSKATVKITTQAYGPVEAGEFTSSAITISSNGSTLSMAGEGTIAAGGGTPEPATLAATQIRTYKQIEEQEAKEKQEREEMEAKENVRGEWSLTLEVGSQTTHGIALVTKDAGSKNEFASSGALFESVIPGTFSGVLEGNKTSTTVTTEAYGPFPASQFTSAAMDVNSSSNPTSITGSGTLTVGATNLPATLTATRIKTYKEVTERLAKEKLEQEAKEKQEKEAKEKLEREAKETLEKEAKEKLEREAKEKLEKEAKEKLEREAREAAEKAATSKSPVGGSGSTPTLVSVLLTGNTLTVGPSQLISLQVTNPNPYAIAGRVTLVAESAKTSKHHTTAGKAISLGTTSFGVSAKGKQTVKLKLSKAGQAAISHTSVLRVIATIATHANGQTTATKSFVLTLHAATQKRGKH